MGKLFKWFVVFVLIIMSILTYARYVGTMGFITKEYTLYHEHLPNDFDGMKIVHFSDIHYSRAITSSKIDEIVDEINLINPDIVVFTGDLIDKDVDLNSNDYKYLTSAFKKINAKYGKYAVIGNHDYKDIESIIRVFDESGFKYLENNYNIIYSRNNEKILIGGIGNVTHNLDDVDSLKDMINTNGNVDYKIMLVHEPDISDKIIDNYDVSLILGGHSHNGQVRIPVIGAIYTPVGSKKYYDEYYKINNTDLYISSGIGVSIANYRLFNKPSINFYRINKK